MRRHIRRRTNRRGEWTVWDDLRGYRICRFHPHAHGGTHVHGPMPGETYGPIDVETADAAEEIMRLYAMIHETFDHQRLLEVIRTWRFASDDA